MPDHDPFPLPRVDETNRPYWQALAEGRLVYQCCKACGHAWLPARSECPRCLAAETGWQQASGRARLVSWVTYRKAFHPAFADRLPYNVSVVELEEGPRLISNLVGLADPEDLAIDEPLALVLREEHGVAIPAFRKAG
ncbi:Zn-ribbon domain-containing OB-fold protein [Stappia indica]|uniref:Zn-ribbon domain-containing OB-fold protein n=1 Tax=Stappia indica TaxID=538381 RepID=UPI00082F156D|nr:OB-fold domain-containing protein [Stappia indica]